MRVTMTQIAERAGVSRTAVSLVLNNTPGNTIADKTRIHILQVARELGYYSQSPLATVCLIFYNCDMTHFTNVYLLKSVEEQAGKLGYTVSVIHIRPSESEWERLKTYLEGQALAGALVTGRIDDSIIQMMRNTQVPYLFYGVVDRHDIPLCVPDLELMAYEGAKQLLSRGHKRIAFFSGSFGLLVHQRTLSGYRRAMTEAGLWDSSLTQASADEDGYEMCRTMDALGSSYTAMFAVNTKIQFGALQYLKEQNVEVPREVSLLGIGNSELVFAATPQLSTIYSHTESSGEAMQRLADMIDGVYTGPLSQLLDQFELYERGTLASRVRIGGGR